MLRRANVIFCSLNEIKGKSIGIILSQLWRVQAAAISIVALIKAADDEGNLLLNSFSYLLEEMRLHFVAFLANICKKVINVLILCRNQTLKPFVLIVHLK